MDEASGRKRVTTGTRIDVMKRLRPRLREWGDLTNESIPEERAAAATALSEQIEALRIVLANEKAYAALEMWTEGYTQVAIAQILGISRTRLNQLLLTVATPEERQQADQRRALNSKGSAAGLRVNRDPNS